MAPDEARAQDVRGWLQKAALDLRAAEHGTSPSEAWLRSDVVFHAQQAIEKAFKAFLAWHDVPFRKTHNLEELGRACAAIDATLLPMADKAAPPSTPGDSDTRANPASLQARRRRRPSILLTKFLRRWPSVFLGMSSPERN